MGLFEMELAWQLARERTDAAGRRGCSGQRLARGPARVDALLTAPHAGGVRAALMLALGHLVHLRVREMESAASPATVSERVSERWGVGRVRNPGAVPATSADTQGQGRPRDRTGTGKASGIGHVQGKPWG